MSAETLIMIAGAVLSLAFGLIPKLKDKYAALEKEIQQTIMLGLVMLAAVTVYGLSCANVMVDLWPEFAVSCDQQSFWLLVRYVIIAGIANQSTFNITKYLTGYKKENR